MGINFSDHLLLESKEQLILYHGTTSEVQRPILSQGLITNPEVKTWAKDDDTSFYRSSRESLEGIYVTRNLMTAISSAGTAIRRRGGQVHVDADPLIVVLTLSEGLLGTSDEDRVTFTVLRMPSPDPRRVGAEQHEHTAMHLYACWLRITHNDWDDIDQKYRDFYKTEMTKEWNDWQQSYADAHTKELASNKHPGFADRLHQLLKDNFIVTLKRLVSHIELSTAAGWNDDHKVLKKYGSPSVQSAESRYLQFMDELTRMVKEPPDRSDFMRNFRVTQNIGYNKRNKIICVMRLVGVPRNERQEGDPYELVKVLYGEPPQDFINQYKERVGELVYFEDWK